MTIRVNLIQQFVFLNLLCMIGMGMYFGFWFSEKLIDSVNRLHSSDLADDLHQDIERRFQFDFFDDLPTDAEEAQKRREVINQQVGGTLYAEVYPTQLLWNPKGVVWSNRPDEVGLSKALNDSLLEEAFGGKDRAELIRSNSHLTWMYKALFDEDSIIEDASSYLRILIPIRFNKDSLVGLQAESEKWIDSVELLKLIESTQPGEDLVAGVLELHKDPRAILKKAVGDVQSIWKRALVVALVTFIALFSLFKSAFNTIERQSRALREQERLSNLGKMASYLAHEIRNPLFIIRGSAQTIEETASESGAGKKLSRYIIDEVDRLNNMVQDLLGLVKPRLAPSRTPTSLAKAISDSAERVLKQAPKIELVPQLDPDHDLVWFNPDQLIQVFTNLFRNASEACRGQGTILIESRISGEGNLQIRITDDGPGIPEEDLASVFEPFFSKREDGTGLGLAIVRHLVTRNNATIDAVKPVGTGACFILRVRLAPAGAQEEAEEDLGGQQSADSQTPFEPVSGASE